MSMSDNDIEQVDNKREARKKRKRKNMITAYIVLVIVLALVAAGGFFGAKMLFEKIGMYKIEQQALAPVVEEPTPEPVIEENEPEEIEEPEAEPTPEPTPEVSEDDLMDEMIESMVAEMSLEDKVAGLFIITPEQLTGQNGVTKAGDGTKTALEEYAVGGIIYNKSNIKSESQVTEMIANSQSYSKYPLFIAVDEEGGDITHIQSGLKLDKVPSAKEMGEANDTNLVYDTYKNIGTYMIQYGFNLNFAPVADILTNADNTVIGDRAFGADTSTVSSLTTNAVLGLKDAGVWTCTKHFPGQGGVDADTHEGMASTDRNWDQMLENEVFPFTQAIGSGTDMIMVGHFAAEKVTGDATPCSMSREIMTDKLRGELEYNGVIITDAFDMKAITEYYAADEAAIKAIKAGADMILMPEDFKTAYEGVLNAVKDGTINEERITDSMKRIFKIKYEKTLDS